MERTPLSEITRKDWIAFQWVDVTEMGDQDRMMAKGYRRTPDEALQAMEEWDATAEERGTIKEVTEEETL